jgi:hypothetical protein
LFIQAIPCVSSSPCSRPATAYRQHGNNRDDDETLDQGEGSGRFEETSGGWKILSLYFADWAAEL